MKNKSPVQPPFDANQNDRLSFTGDLEDIELPEELIQGYKELNEKLEETIQRIQRKRQQRRRRRA